eukprot:gene28082-31190_t
MGIAALCVTLGCMSPPKTKPPAAEEAAKTSSKSKSEAVAVAVEVPSTPAGQKTREVNVETANVTTPTYEPQANMVGATEDDKTVGEDGACVAVAELVPVQAEAADRALPEGELPTAPAFASVAGPSTPPVTEPLAEPPADVPSSSKAVPAS